MNKKDKSDTRRGLRYLDVGGFLALLNMIFMLFIFDVYFPSPAEYAFPLISMPIIVYCIVKSHDKDVAK